MDSIQCLFMGFIVLLYLQLNQKYHQLFNLNLYIKKNVIEKFRISNNKNI